MATATAAAAGGGTGGGGGAAGAAIQDDVPATAAEQLPPPTAVEVAEFNALLNAQATYTASAALLRDKLDALLGAGQVARAIGFVRGEAVLIVYMRDNILAELLERYLSGSAAGAAAAAATEGETAEASGRHRRDVALFHALAPLVQARGKVAGLLTRHFDAAVAAGDMARARAIVGFAAFDGTLSEHFRQRLNRADARGEVKALFEGGQYAEAFAAAEAAKLQGHELHAMCRAACGKLLTAGDYETPVREIFPRVNKSFRWNETFATSLMQAATTAGALRVAVRNVVTCRPKQQEWRPLSLLRTLDHCARKWAQRLRVDLVEVLQAEARDLVPATDRKDKVTTPPADFCCPITTCLMAQPMRTPLGHCFERSAIATWVATNRTCPLTRQPLVMEQLVPDRELTARIDAWRQAHTHGELHSAIKDAERQVQVRFAAGHLQRGDIAQCVEVLTALPSGPRRVTDVQTCVREALSAEDGETATTAETLSAVFGVLGSPQLEVSSLLITLCHLVQFDPRWTYARTRPLLPPADVMAAYAPHHAVRYYFFAYFKGEQDHVGKAAIVAAADLVTATMGAAECNSLRLELEMAGGMSNDHRLFPFHLPGQPPAP